MRALCVLLLLAGCDRLLGLKHLPDTATSDGQPPQGDSSGLIDAEKIDAGTSSGDSKVADALGTTCPAGYTTYSNGNHYRIVMQQANWDDAHADCADDLSGSTRHTHLVVLADDAERSDILAYAGTAVWIGLRDRFHDDQYEWINGQTNGYPPPNGTAMTDAWAPNEPSGGTSDCVYENSLGQLVDEPCTTSFLTVYVCECDAFAQEF